MNIDNNTRFAVETIPYMGPDGRAFATIMVKGTFDMHHQSASTVAEEQLPIAYGDEPYDPEDGGSIKFEADIAPFKPRADIVLVGHAYAPAGLPASCMDVSLRVGRLQKILRIFGDRQWQYSTLSLESTTEPKPFDKMPLVYERSFGGIDQSGGGFCPQNLVGQSYFEKVSNKSVHGAALPNIEDPHQLIRSPKDQPRPMGYGFYGRAWEPRIKHLGTYDEHWRKTRSPDLPHDFKYDYYNAAHPDLQLEGYLRGDEELELINLTPQGNLSTRLPSTMMTARIVKTYDTLKAYLENKDPENPDLETMPFMEPTQESIELVLDTLCLIPDEHQYFLIWRGRTATYDLTALEIETIEIYEDSLTLSP